MPEIVVRDCRLFYTVEGPADAPVLLLSNALGTTSDLWTRQMPAFARRFRVVRYHTRGHGRSAGPAPAGGSTLSQLAHDALGILDAIGADRAHICGCSLGGLTAMWLGLHAPARVDRLVLANTAARIGTADFWQQRIDQVRARGMVAASEGATQRWFTEPFRRRAPLMAACTAMLADCPADGYIACCAVLRDADLREHVARIGAPTLVISGTYDPVTTPGDGRFLQQHIAGAQFIELPAAHFSNVEAAAAFTAAALRFLIA